MEGSSVPTAVETVEPSRVKRLWSSRGRPRVAVCLLALQRLSSGLLPAITLHVAAGDVLGVFYALVGPPIWALPIALTLGSLVDCIDGARNHDGDAPKLWAVGAGTLITVSSVVYAVSLVLTKGKKFEPTVLGVVGVVFLVLVTGIFAVLAKVYSLPRKD